MVGLQRFGAVQIGGAFDNAWDVPTVLVLEGYGCAHFVLRRAATKSVSFWLMSGIHIDSSSTCGVDVGTWAVGGAGTFGGGTFGDGSSSLWFMEGSTRISSAIVDVAAGASWVVSNACE